mgnify:CR=1 FL=1
MGPCVLLVVIFAGADSTNFNYFRKEVCGALSIGSPRRIDNAPFYYISEERIECLDLLPAFREYKDQALYWKEDDHLNVEGNNLAAHNIIKFLNEK